MLQDQNESTSDLDGFVPSDWHGSIGGWVFSWLGREHWAFRRAFNHCVSLLRCLRSFPLCLFSAFCPYLMRGIAVVLQPTVLWFLFVLFSLICKSGLLSGLKDVASNLLCFFFCFLFWDCVSVNYSFQLSVFGLFLLLLLLLVLLVFLLLFFLLFILTWFSCDFILIMILFFILCVCEQL